MTGFFILYGVISVLFATECFFTNAHRGDPWWHSPAAAAFGAVVWPWFLLREVIKTVIAFCRRSPAP